MGLPAAALPGTVAGTAGTAGTVAVPPTEARPKEARTSVHHLGALTAVARMAAARLGREQTPSHSSR